MAGRYGTLSTPLSALGFAGLTPQTHKCALGLTLNSHNIPQMPRRWNGLAHDKRQRVRGVRRNEQLQLSPESALGSDAVASMAITSLEGVQGEEPRLSKTPLPRRELYATLGDET